MSTFGNFEYSVNNGSVVIEKYTGTESFVIIPDSIEGIPVTQIGDEAFRNHGEIKEVIFPKSIVYAGNYAFCECRALKEADFSDNLNFAGAHLFYNCRALEKIRIPSKIEYIGDGFAKNCESLNEITITDDKISSSVSGFLSELSGEIVLNIENNNCSLIFPGYGYEYIDKCYSKTFVTVTHGAGVMYRKAIDKNKINYAVYDSAFKYASNEEFPQTLCLIAINRLEKPYGLTEEAKEEYIKYLSGNISETIDVISQSENIEFLEKMESLDILNADNIKDAIDETVKNDRADFTAELMDIKMRKFGRKKKTFDL